MFTVNALWKNSERALSTFLCTAMRLGPQTIVASQKSFASRSLWISPFGFSSGTHDTQTVLPFEPILKLAPRCAALHFGLRTVVTIVCNLEQKCRGIARVEASQMDGTSYSKRSCFRSETVGPAGMRRAEFNAHRTALHRDWDFRMVRTLWVRLIDPPDHSSTLQKLCWRDPLGLRSGHLQREFIR